MQKTSLTTRGFTLVETMVVVGMIGLLAATAIPTFDRVRILSVDKAVLNNARQLSAAAEQYFLENGVSIASLGDLVSYTKYVKPFSLVASETYPAVYAEGKAITISGVGGQRTITYAP